MSDDRCKYIFTRGPRKNKQCPNSTIQNDYCEYCLEKKTVRDQLNRSSFDNQESPTKRIESKTTCRICHSKCMHWVNITGGGHSPDYCLDPDDGFLEGFLCLNCGMFNGKWPHQDD